MSGKIAFYFSVNLGLHKQVFSCQFRSADKTALTKHCLETTVLQNDGSCFSPFFEHFLCVPLHWPSHGSPKNAEAEGGGGGGRKTYHVNLGGGGNALQNVLSKTTFGGLRNWGWSGQCLFRLRELTESRQKRGGGGETYRKAGGGGPKTLLARGFTVRYVPPPPLSFPPPLAAL